MGSQAPSFFKENNLTLYKIMMVLLLSCTNDNNYDISSSSSSSSYTYPFSSLSPYQQHIIPPQAQVALSSLPIDGHFKFDNIEYAAKDFGGTSHFLPLAVLHPKSVSDISTTIKYVFNLGPTSEVTIAARGHAHSLQGQAQALGGVVVNMESLELLPNKIRVCKGYAEVSGGELWIDILRETLKYGVAPKSWTDYLHLTVGGTLSNAGISGQAFRHGPQISNVYELEVITGKGEIVTCSEKQNPDLFFGVLGGLGQFGVITKARISLGPAAKRVQWIRLVYDDFSLFTTDQEHLISLDDAFDYVEGFVLINRTGLVNSWRSSFNPKHPHQASQFKSEGRILYCLEVAMYFNPEEYEAVTQKTELLLSKLSYIPCIIFTSEVSLIEFLDRVHVSEVRLHAKGLWEVPHPWLNLMVPRSKVADFAKAVFGNIVTDSANGPILIYPVDKSKWDNRTSLVTPDEDIIYLVAFLSSAMPDSKGKDGLEHILGRNRKVMEFCSTMILGIKQYLPHYNTREEWKTHYGAKWEAFVRRKLEYDPLKILAPGQRIFPKRIPMMM